MGAVNKGLEGMGRGGGRACSMRGGACRCEGKGERGGKRGRRG